MIALPERPNWQQRGACQGVDPALFYPGRGGDTAAAKAICSVCPVVAECLQYAIEAGERLGIWGGQSERQRRQARRHFIRPPRPTVCTFAGCTNKPYAAGRCRRHHREQERA